MFIIYGNDYKNPLFNQLSSDIKIYSIEEFNVNCDVLPQNAKICVTHEEALEALRHKMPADNYNAKAMELFRNKAALRSKLSQAYPEFYFKKVKLSNLSKQVLDFTRLSQYVIKPVKGFFGIGVRVITSHTNLKDLQSEIESEIKTQGIDHPEYIRDESLSAKDFLIEEYIGVTDYNYYSLENAEIAVDGYYNQSGQFILLAIYHHPYRKDRKYFHTLYYTSKELFDKFSAEIVNFFEDLQKNLKLNLKSFPIHAEFRNYKDKLFVIEINPGRFGGLGLGDLIFYSFGINPYELFFKDESFDWHDEWKKAKKKYFAWVLAYKGEDFKNKQSYFSHRKFKKFLGNNLIKYEPIDYDNSVSGIAYISKNRKEELCRIVNVEFNKYSYLNKISNIKYYLLDKLLLLKTKFFQKKDYNHSNEKLDVTK